jgi:hypothetical protein
MRCRRLDETINSRHNPPSVWFINPPVEVKATVLEPWRSGKDLQPPVAVCNTLKTSEAFDKGFRYACKWPPEFPSKTVGALGRYKRSATCCQRRIEIERRFEKDSFTSQLTATKTTIVFASPFGGKRDEDNESCLRRLIECSLTSE